MRHTIAFGTLGITLFLGILAACGDDDVAPAQDAGTAETGTIDTGSADAPNGARETLGGKCASDDACAEGLVCFKRGVADRWPAHGYCTKKCTNNAECGAIQSGATCTTFLGTEKWCFEPCTQGPAGIQTITAGQLPNKCHGRNDVACRKESEGASCRPLCNDDSACEGAKCDPAKAGACSETSSGSFDDIGNGDDKPCSTGLGTGVSGPDSGNVCTAICTGGTVPSCGWPGPGTKAKAACLLFFAGTGQGDGAMCSRLCDSDCDCENGQRCSEFATSDLKTATQRAGACGKNPTTSIACDAGTDAGDGG